MKTNNSQDKDFSKPDLGSKVQDDAQAAPAPSNEVGQAISQTSEMQPVSDTPRLVIRGESFNNNLDSNEGDLEELFAINGKPVVISTSLPKSDGNPYSAFTDFLNCTFLYESQDLDSLLFDLIDCLGKAFTPITDRNKGLHGWQHSYQLGDSKTFLAYGGQQNTIFLSIPGEGCHMVPDWDKLVLLLKEQYRAKITRWDGAVDDYEGVHSVDDAVQLFKNNMFNAGGRAPDCNQHGNWIQPSGKGRTFEVGSRKNGKMIRIYEKGMQLGAEWHPWTRWEVEMHSVDRVIPWDVLLQPGKFVAGSYPKALNWIQDDIQRIKTVKKTAVICYESQIKYAKLSYGKLLNVMLEVEGSRENVFNKLARNGIPKSLNLPIVAKNEGWNK